MKNCARPPVVFLPVTEPADPTYGCTPEALPSRQVRAVRFPRLVWYNAEVRAQAVAQMRAMALPPSVLVGFSKSGLGAWNIAREHPDLVQALVIFDAPVCRDTLPPWLTEAFYADDAAWQADLPMRQLCAGLQPPCPPGGLVLVTGCSFHGEMVDFSRALEVRKVVHTRIDSPERPHHWASGWIEAALAALGPCGGSTATEAA